MQKRKKNTKLSRDTAHRNALLRNLAQELFKHGKIKTTLPKAKALRPFVEPLITKAKTQDAHAERLIAKVLYDHEIVRKLIDDIAPRYTNRPGGYTRIIKLGPRQGDSAKEAIVQLVQEAKVKETTEEKKEDK